MDIGRLEGLLFEKHVVKAGQDHTCNGNNGTFMAAALPDTVIFGPKIRILLILNGGKGTLDQQGFEVSPSSGNPAALLPGALVVLRGKAGPGAEVLSGFEYRHVCPDLGNDVAGGGFGNAWDIGGKPDKSS